MDGKQRWLNVRGGVMNSSHSRPLRIIGVLTDITAAKNLEIKYATQCEVLERAQQTALVGDWVWQPSRGYFCASKQLSVNYSQVSKGDVEEEAIDTRGCVNEIIDSMRILVDEKRAHIVVDPTMPTIVTREAFFREVFQNLIINAIKYNDKDRTVIHIGCKQESERFVFYINDNGCGIPSSEHERIFTVFHRSVNNGLDVEGVGAGLAIVKKLVARLGGEIW